MRFLHDDALNKDDNVNLSLYLPLADQTIQLKSRVITCGEEKTSTKRPYEKPYFVQVEFQNVNEQVHLLLKNHIDNVRAKTGTEQMSYMYC